MLNRFICAYLAYLVSIVNNLVSKKLWCLLENLVSINKYIKQIINTLQNTVSKAINSNWVYDQLQFKFTKILYNLKKN